MSAAGALGWLLPGVALMSALLVQATLHYARRRGLLDLPGQRRSHRIATPRGGGLGVAAAFCAGLGAAAGWELMPWSLVACLLPPLLLVAAVGFWDDHRALPALPRLLVHLSAGVLLLHCLPPLAPAWLPWPAALALATLAVATLLNFWNFMDGINGLAAAHAAWIAVVLGVELFAAGHGPEGWVAALLAMAVLGFLPFNLPRARIFLGDVGSGFLGFAVAAMLLLAWRADVFGLPALLLLPSFFLLDAGATLALRMAAGRRWYTAHRSHLYQWLARRGRAHTRIVSMSLLWNIPATALAVHLGSRQDGPAWLMTGAVFGMGLLGWFAWRARLRREAAGVD